MVRMTTRKIALISVFAALIVIVSRLPGIPLLGGPGAGGGRIELTTVLYPLVGVLLGPWLGVISVLAGNVITWIMPTATVFGLLMIPAGAVASFISGSLTRQSKWFNWKSAAIVLSLLIVAWYTTPTGRSIPIYPILHWTALGFVLIFRERINALYRGESRSKMLIGAAICSFVATMGEHLVGSLIWMASAPFYVNLKLLRDGLRNVMGPYLGEKWIKSGMLLKPDDPLSLIFMATLFPLPIYPIERFLITAVSTVLSVAIIRSIGFGRLSLGNGRT